MSHFFLLALTILSFSSYAELQCLSKDSTIPGHCKKAKKSQITCFDDTRPYDCHNLAQECPGYRLEKEAYGFNDFQPSPSTIQNVSFPRNDRYIYRGIPHSISQITKKKFISAVLGDDLQNVGTLYQWRASQYLKGEIRESDYVRNDLVTGVQLTTIEQMMENMRVKSDFLKLKDCKSRFSERDAQRYASDLMMKSFKKIQEEKLTERYFLKSDYSFGSDYRAYGNWGEHLLFGSVYSNVASWLSGKMIMYNNSKSRSIDLNYYNYMNGEKWTYADADNGELVTPGALTADELEGLILSDSNPKSTDRLTPSNINIAFLRYTEGNTNYVLIVDGEYKHCLTKDSNGKPRFCDQRFKSQGITPDNPSASPKRLIFGVASFRGEASIMGIIRKKQPIEREVDMSHLLKKFKISKRKLDPSLIYEIENLKFFNGDKVMTTQLAVPKEEEKKKIYIVSANFGRGHKNFTENNLHSYVSDFCGGKESCDYGVQPGRFFPELVEDSQSAQLEVTFRCLKDNTSKQYQVKTTASNVLSLSCS